MSITPSVAVGLDQLSIELPSWAFGNSGTRFKVFAQPGVPRDPFEKIADAARVHAHTGTSPSVALHIPWDKVDDYGKLDAFAADHGVRIGAINANVFQDDDYRLGSVGQPGSSRAPQGDLAPARMRRHHGRDGVTGSQAVVRRRHRLPGPGLARSTRQQRLADALAETYARLGANQRMLLEYKLFEPAFYTTDVPDWGTAYAHCVALGERTKVILDTGHHAPGTNIEFIVMTLLRLGKLGGFDFNSRFYADDDLMVGAADPFQLFRIMHEIVQRRRPRPAQRRGVHARPVPQHRGEDPGGDPLGDERPGSDGEGLARRTRVRCIAAQQAGDVLGANAVLMDAYNTDVRPLLADHRACGRPRSGPDRGVSPLRLRRPDPVGADRRSGRRLGA